VFPGRWTSDAKSRGEKPPRLQMECIGTLFKKLLNEMADWKTSGEYKNGMRHHYSTGRNAFTDERNRRITFYSAVRSTSLTHQIRAGRPIAELAELAGTSVKMIELHYRAEMNQAQAKRYANTQEHRPYWKRYNPKTVPYAERDVWVNETTVEEPQLDRQEQPLHTETPTTEKNKTSEGYDWDELLGPGYN
jgi:hypothetical protein